ncbi:MAG: metalloregulator ArsR/SmtB family transcription factor, partial [Leptotrichiaceae bacterium]
KKLQKIYKGEMFEMDLVEIYKALGEITRLRIIMLLLDKKMCGYHIENTLNVSQSNISRHLTKLKYAKIVKEEKEGQKIYFSINSNFIEKYNLLYESLLGNRVTHEIFMSDEVKYFENKDELDLSYSNIAENI